MRAATPADAEALGAVHVHSWRAAYRGFVAIGASRDPDTDPGRLGEGYARYLLSTH